MDPVSPFMLQRQIVYVQACSAALCMGSTFQKCMLAGGYGVIVHRGHLGFLASQGAHAGRWAW